MSNHARKTAEMEREAAPVLPNSCFLRHGYDLEEGPHSAADIALLERDGKVDNGSPIRRVRSGVRRLFQDNKITGAEMAATERWAGDYGLGVHGASDPLRRGSSCRGDIHSFRVACLDAAARHREAAATLGPHGDMLLTEFCFRGKGLAAMARQQALKETPTPGETATKAQRKSYEGAVEKKAQPYTQALVRELVATIKALGDFYEARADDKKQPSWWKPVDPDTGKVVLRSRYGSVQQVPGAALKRAA